MTVVNKIRYFVMKGRVRERENDFFLLRFGCGSKQRALVFKFDSLGWGALKGSHNPQ